MSSNPFDDDFDTTAKSTAGGAAVGLAGGVPPPSSQSRTMYHHHHVHHHHHHHQQQHIHHRSLNRGVPGGVVTDAPSFETGGLQPQPSSEYDNNSSSNNNNNEPPIWMARNVDWPIPTFLPPNTYTKLLKMSREAGKALGIDITTSSSTSVGPGSYAASAGAGVAGAGAGAGGGMALEEEDIDDLDGDGTPGGGGGAGGSGYYAAGGIAGLMSRVMGAQSSAGGSGAAGAGSGVDGQGDDDGTSTSSAHRSRPLRPPRNRCVASSNGWIVAVVECPALSPTSQLPPLRLVSRWNVRRGSTSTTGENLIPLLPPVRSSVGGGSSAGGSLNTLPAAIASRIMHTFVDPTGCHTLISARNGEVYYLHSTSRRVKKLKGFGPNPDGSTSFTPGKAAGDIKGGSGKTGKSEKAQVGLTPGTYLTAVGWDEDQGTERSTKLILLGNSSGELYEYALVAPSADAPTEASDVAPDFSDGPILLHRLNSSESVGMTETGASVTGVHFEHLANPVSSAQTMTVPSSAAKTGIIVLAATSGSNRRTRLHTYQSGSPAASTFDRSGKFSFRGVFIHGTKGSHSSFVELPGSVDFADLNICGDGFAMRTEIGIYYGTIDRGGKSGGASSIKSSGGAGGMGSSSAPGGSGIVDAGILPYDSGHHQSVGTSGATSSVIPVSLALTPHHFITVSATNEVRFVNRVARKVIQQERVDWVAMSQQISSPSMPASSVVSDGALFDEHMGTELMMDIRRPDQVWLRKNRSLVHISSSCEDRDVWKFTLTRCLELPLLSRGGGGTEDAVGSGTKQGLHKQPSSSTSSGGLTSYIPPLGQEEKMQEMRFEQAKSLCSNAAQKAVVTAARAEFHLAQGRVELAAKYMAQCPPNLMPFADTAIRLALPTLGVDDPKSYGGSKQAQEALAGSNMALITYLSDRMRLAKANNDGVVCTMIGAWLAELHLNEREKGGPTGTAISDSVVRLLDKPVAAGSSSTNALLQQFLSANVRCTDPKAILRILSSHDVNASECASYAAMSGDIGTAINAALCGDNGKNGALDALRVLNDSPIEQAEPYYYKHSTTLLSRAPMAAAKSFLARYPQGLSAKKLLPAIMHYERRRVEMREAATAAGVLEREVHVGRDSKGGTPSRLNKDGPKTAAMHIDNVQIEKGGISDSGVEVLIDQLGGSGHAMGSKKGPHSISSFVDDEHASVKYLEGVIAQGCKSSAVFNYLISLYAAMDDEVPLFKFLSKHVPMAASASGSATSSKKEVGIGDALLRQKEMGSSPQSPLDMSYALRVILRTGRHFRSAVKLYMGFGMRQQAVELALKVDPALARELAKESIGSDEKKRLWLMIARNAAADGDNRGGKDVVANVVSVLRECGGPEVLSIEDVLPFLPDFAQIDQFKDEICGALTSYSSKIEQYLKEMNDCDQICDTLRDEIDRLGNHGFQMKADARCAFTKKSVLNEDEPFYVFPSGYVALESALKKEVVPHLNEKQRNRVKSIEEELNKLRDKSKFGSQNRIGECLDSNDLRKEELQYELDGLIAAECPLTGTMMVDSIDRGFLDSLDEDEIYTSFENPTDTSFAAKTKEEDMKISFTGQYQF